MFTTFISAQILVKSFIFRRFGQKWVPWIFGVIRVFRSFGFFLHFSKILDDPFF